MHVSDGEGVLALSESQGVRLLWVWHQKVTCWFLPQVSRGRARSYRHHIWDFHFAWTIDRSRGITPTFFPLPQNITDQLWRTTCVTVCMYTTLHISSLKLQQAKSSFLNRFQKHLFLLHGQKAMPQQECYFVLYSTNGFRKWRGLVEIVRESHIPNSQWLVKKACPVFCRTQDVKEFPSVNVLKMYFFFILNHKPINKSHKRYS